MQSENSPLIKKRSLSFLGKIFTFALLLDGVFTVLAGLFFGGGLSAFSKLKGLALLMLVLFSLCGVGKIVVAYGLRKMKRWAVYVLSVLLVVNAILTIAGGTLMIQDIFLLAVNFIIVGYFWSLIKNFN